MVTQFAKDEVELAGLIKFDFLGLKTLTVIAYAVGHIQKRTDEGPLGPNPQFDAEHIPLNAPEVYDLIGQADTDGVFQLESSGFKELLKRLKPDCFEDVVAAVAGSLRSILAAERCALNFLQRLCGVATWTARHVAEAAGTGCRVADTRKTLPGWRVLDKAAVRHGGGVNHRHHLADGVLIKDNHVAAAGGVAAAVAAARRQAHHLLKVEVEVDTFDQLEEALAAGADCILLDNMTPAQVSEALRVVAGRAFVEASGGIDLKTLAAFAATGVPQVALGALTHSAPAADVALDVIEGLSAKA